MSKTVETKPEPETVVAPPVPVPDPVAALSALGGIREILAELVEARFQKGITEKDADQQYEEQLALVRKRNPPLHEEAIECVSPLTKSTFIAICQRGRAPGSTWRVVSLADYTLPAGWDVHVKDGGLVPDGCDIRNQTGQYDQTFMWEHSHARYRADNDALIRTHLPLPDIFRKGYAPAPGSVVLTPDQLKTLGITSEQIKLALGATVSEAAE
jgi:hypothetical protein